MSDQRDISVENMNAELVAADPVLVGNDALLASVLAGCGDCIKILDLQGRLLFMSEGGKRVMEVDDFGSLQGCPWPDLWAGNGNVAAKQAVESAANGKPACFVGDANTAKGNPKFWSVEVLPIQGPDGKPSHLLSISRDITESTNMQQRHDLLAAELHHRIKNTIAVVGIIAARTFRGDDVADRRSTFQARIKALSSAQDLLIARTWQKAPIRSVVESALTPLLSTDNRLSISGEHLELDARQALSIALAVHELATNATKYGALSVPGGEVDISWRTDSRNEIGEPVFQFAWQESGGPAVQIPSSKGFGSQLIEKVLAEDFGGEVDVRYNPTGVACFLRSPMTNFVQA